jgi:hypothetical protein
MFIVKCKGIHFTNHDSPALIEKRKSASLFFKISCTRCYINGNGGSYSEAAIIPLLVYPIKPVDIFS